MGFAILDYPRKLGMVTGFGRIANRESRIPKNGYQKHNHSIPFRDHPRFMLAFYLLQER